MNFIRNWLTKARNPHNPLITVALSKAALLHNLKEFQQLSPAVAPVLKGNAYGHGLIEIASILEKEHLPLFIVDSYTEARSLRAAGITTPLLIIGFTKTETIRKSKLPHTSFVVTSYEALEEYAQLLKKPTKIHLKIDTGMCRQGITLDQTQQAIDLIKKSPRLILEGICSHFADADNLDTSFTQNQIDVWNDCVDLFMKHFLTLSYYHTSNTAGHAYIRQARSNISRLGIGLYGLTGNGAIDTMVALQPVMKVTTSITGTKNIPTNSKVGYNGTFTTTSPTKLATIPMGYFEGVDRRLSNKGMVMIGDAAAKIAGRVSMNITILDITNIPDVDNIKLGTEVTVISSRESDPNSIVNIAKTCGTIPYEIAVHVNAALQRIVI